ncbi:biotin holocarboxylase synthetase [Dinochytrium kinnereticum]|nr:biotin holocarboxylase synthetase [Dinochytrium kinnereticum]
MNVLVYAGAGTSKGSVESTLKALRKTLSSSYDVIPVDSTVLTKEPWQGTTSLLVVPGGRDLPYVENLSPDGTFKIKNWVKEGGNYLGICAGAYFGCSKVEFERGRKDYEVIGSRDLCFVEAIAKGSSTLGFKYNDETTGSAISVSVDEFEGLSDSTMNLYANGGPYFELPDENAAGLKVIARYSGGVVDEAVGKIAIIEAAYGRGKAVLSGPHLECDPVDVVLPGPSKDVLIESNVMREKLMSGILRRFGLRLNDYVEVEEAKPTTMFLCSDPENVASLDPWLNTFKFDVDQSVLVEDSLNKIQLRKGDARRRDTDDKLVDVAIYRELLPEIRQTPKFDVSSYFSYLKRLRADRRASGSWKYGSVLLYGEVVNSTHTLLEKNSNFFGGAPEGITCVGSRQLLGRGRGKNSWISQDGCLQFSFSLAHKNPKTALFVQYIFALAVVEALRTRPGCQQLPIRIKWPNDIYCVETGSDGEKVFKKLGGILVTSSYESGVFNILIGCGLNVANSRPTLSVNDLIRTYNLSNSSNPLTEITVEEALSRILVTFEEIYRDFSEDTAPFPFEKLLPKYYEYWLHSDQAVSLEGKTDATIKGIDTSGLLKATDENGESYLLQPDGNTFDMMKGLISRKQ